MSNKKIDYIKIDPNVDILKAESSKVTKLKQSLFIDVVHDNVSRNNFLSHLLGSSIVTTYQGSGGHGYDIPTNGGRHKKVVTGKAGNQYPVVKRRGVK